MSPLLLLPLAMVSMLTQRAALCLRYLSRRGSIDFSPWIRSVIHSDMFDQVKALAKAHLFRGVPVTPTRIWLARSKNTWSAFDCLDLWDLEERTKLQRLRPFYHFVVASQNSPPTQLISMRIMGRFICLLLISLVTPLPITALITASVRGLRRSLDCWRRKDNQSTGPQRQTTAKLEGPSL
jgi:hypothetical protein